MLLPSSAEVSQGYANGRTLTVNVVVTYRKLFLPVIFESHDSQHNRKHSILPSALINSLTGSLLWFMDKTDYFCRLFFMTNTRSEQQFYSVTARGTTDGIPQPNNIIFVCFPLHSKYKRSIFAQLQWKPTSMCWSFHWSPSVSKPPWLYNAAILNIAGFWCLFSVAPFWIIWDCVRDTLNSTRPS